MLRMLQRSLSLALLLRRALRLLRLLGRFLERLRWRLRLGTAPQQPTPRTAGHINLRMTAVTHWRNSMPRGDRTR